MSSSSDSDSPNFKTPSPPTPPVGLQPPPPSIAVAATKAAAATSSREIQPSSSSSPVYSPQPLAVVDKESLAKAKSVTDALNKILSSAPDPSSKLLQDSTICSDIYTLLREPASGSGDNPLCRWLYDTFNLGSQSDLSTLHLVVLRFVPLLTGLYLSRASSLHSRPHLPLAGFEAVLLALYAHQTTARNGQPMTVTLPDLSNPSIYHEGGTGTSASPTTTTAATELHIAVTSPALEPHGTVRSTRRARIVGVALELYYSKIDVMPVRSNLDFCEFVIAWAGGEEGGEESKGGGEGSSASSSSSNGIVITEGKRIPLPWELMQPVLRILGHCLMGGSRAGDGAEGKVLYEKACKACRCLYTRAVQDINPKAMLATQSLLNIIKIDAQGGEIDYTEIPKERVINLSDP